MTSYPPPRSGRGWPARAALTAAALALGGVAAAPAVSRAATMTTLYASPTGSGTACSSAAPCSLTQAKASVEAIDGNMSGDIVVQLAGGTYRLSAPLVFDNADSGTNGHNIIFQAAPGATPGDLRRPAGDRLDAARLGRQHLLRLRAGRHGLPPAVRRRVGRRRAPRSR